MRASNLELMLTLLEKASRTNEGAFMEDLSKTYIWYDKDSFGKVHLVSSGRGLGDTSRCQSRSYASSFSWTRVHELYYIIWSRVRKRDQSWSERLISSWSNRRSLRSAWDIDNALRSRNKTTRVEVPGSGSRGSLEDFYKVSWTR